MLLLAAKTSGVLTQNFLISNPKTVAPTAWLDISRPGVRAVVLNGPALQDDKLLVAYHAMAFALSLPTIQGGVPFLHLSRSTNHGRKPGPCA